MPAALDRCARCNWPYPSGYLHVMVGSMITRPVCGICGLAMKNAIHGTRDLDFSGPMAEDVRLDAVAWRESHQLLKPKEDA